MVFATKSSSNSSSNEGNWGMGFLLVFFHHNPDEDDPHSTTTHHNLKRRPSFSLSSPLKLSAITASKKGLVSKAQSTLSICGLLVFTTLLLFTLSTFEPGTSVNGSGNSTTNRRILRSNDKNSQPKFSISTFFGGNLMGKESNFATSSALQGMGKLYRRGSKGMTDLVVGHVAEGATEREIATFLRLIHHSGLMSRSDLVLIFDLAESASRLGGVVEAESESFLRLVSLYREVNVNVSVGPGPDRGPGFGLARYMRPVGEDDKEALWGKKGNFSELTRASYGSVVGFYSSELDPEDSLSGFLDKVPMGLRRWACYPMLLGRVRRNFKHTMLVDVRNSLILSDPFARVRNKTSESLLVWPNSDTTTESTRSHGRRNSGGGSNCGTHLNPGAIVGGARGVRRFANAAVTDIVRAVVEHKGKGGRNPVTESGLVNQLVHSGHFLKSINLITSTESIPKASSLAGFNSLDSAGSGFLAFSEYFSVVQRGHGSSSGGNVIDIDSVVRKEICSSNELYSSVYRDCLASQ